MQPAWPDEQFWNTAPLTVRAEAAKAAPPLPAAVEATKVEEEMLLTCPPRYTAPPERPELQLMNVLPRMVPVVTPVEGPDQTAPPLVVGAEQLTKVLPLTSTDPLMLMHPPPWPVYVNMESKRHPDTVSSAPLARTAPPPRAARGRGARLLGAARELPRGAGPGAPRVRAPRWR